jgi:hypothetical protein
MGCFLYFQLKLYLSHADKATLGKHKKTKESISHLLQDDDKDKMGKYKCRAVGNTVLLSRPTFGIASATSPSEVCSVIPDKSSLLYYDPFHFDWSYW